MATFRADSVGPVPHIDPPSHIEELAAELDAARWARICAWAPGTGYCRDRDCGDACIFRAQRETEARRVVRWRRLRRIFAGRRVR